MVRAAISGTRRSSRHSRRSEGERSRSAIELRFTSSGHPEGSADRRVFLDDYPYAIVYAESDDAIHVIAFAHLKRRPLYWRRRVTSIIAATRPKKP